MRITFCLSLAYITALSTAQTIQRLMMSLVVNDELGGMWKEFVLIQLQVLCGHLLRQRHITRVVEGRASLECAWPTAPRLSVVMNSNITTAILWLVGCKTGILLPLCTLSWTALAPVTNHFRPTLYTAYYRAQQYVCYQQVSTLWMADVTSKAGHNIYCEHSTYIPSFQYFTYCYFDWLYLYNPAQSYISDRPIICL
jgi:hypothetical protein